MITVYLAKRNSDLTEGRGPMITIAAFLNREDAERAAKGWGVMGVGDGEVESLKVFDNHQEYKNRLVHDLRQSALKKLTPEEIEALGLE